EEGCAVVASLRGVRKHYAQGASRVEALRGVDLTVVEGEMLAICGPSGSGKSTLLNLIGLLDEPSEGEVSVVGRPIATLSGDARAELRSSSIGFIFQSFNLVPVLTALENVLLPLSLRGRVSGDDRRRALALLEAVGVGELLASHPDRMSGGQRQRVAIARALVTQPRLVVADEPTANLDTETSLRVMDLIAGLQQAHGVSFVFSTHDDRILGHMTRIVRLRDGQIETEGC
ncbi:MAG: ABC transporter ATP-binding protein, partial [Rhodocyclaceae bacterium]|nr:ABC transporter ATP-binding protein [Rhodocyclaceae bacterium]